MPADDYYALFRDAVHMLAACATAAGFDPTDETVEPPAIIARVERLRAEVARLRARLAEVEAERDADRGAAEELRRTLAAELGERDGGADLGFEPSSGGWYRPLGPPEDPDASCAVVERMPWGSLSHCLSVYPDGGSSYHLTARAAMRALATGGER